jgi:hypothetical protein
VERVVVEHDIKALRTQIVAVGDLHREIRAEQGQAGNQNGKHSHLGSVQKDSRKHEGPFRKQGIGIVVSVPGRSSQLRPQAACLAVILKVWRREWDSNPAYNVFSIT